MRVVGLTVILLLGVFDISSATPHDIREVESLSTSYHCAPDETDHQYGSCNTCVTCCSAVYSTQTLCNACVASNCSKEAWPGEPFLAPGVHFSPPTLHAPLREWHDVAATLTFKGKHHVFMGAGYALDGWAHYMSPDLVHWKEVPGAPRRIQEHFDGFSSDSMPCSGFLTVDDNGIPCAGFRQCGSSQGVVGGNPWDAPLEVRCAANDDLTEWEEPDYLFDVFFYRPLPYDPARPWQDDDGRWYVLLSTDACNSTTRSLPCNGGGRLDMFSSPKLRGPEANWTYVGPMFESNRTVLADAFLTYEFVTVDYVGGFPGDPDQGETRIFFNNVGGNPVPYEEGCCSATTGYFVGNQKNGSPLEVDFDKDYSMGMIDWGAFSFLPGAEAAGTKGIGALAGNSSRGISMSRTLSTTDDANLVQANHRGRRVLIAWMAANMDNGASAMALPRDMSLDASYHLLQAFIPELQTLRILPGRTMDKFNAQIKDIQSQQVEIFALFTWTTRHRTQIPSAGPVEFGIRVLTSADESEGTKIGLRPETEHVIIDGTTQGNSVVRAGPLFWREGQSTESAEVHIIVDHQIIEVIVNNRTALTTAVTPSSAACTGIELYGDLSHLVWVGVDAWELKSIEQR